MNLKYIPGDLVRIVSGGKQSKDVYEVVEVYPAKHKCCIMNSATFNVVDNVPEANLTFHTDSPATFSEKETELVLQNETDRMLDEYRDYISLYKLFGDSDYKEKAEKVKRFFEEGR